MGNCFQIVRSIPTTNPNVKGKLKPVLLFLQLTGQKAPDFQAGDEWPFLLERDGVGATCPLDSRSDEA
jgi:hypothetical protein